MRQSTKVATEDEGTVRLSVTFTQSQHDQIAEIAARNEVSVGYVVRKACDAFIRWQATEACIHELAEPSNV